MIQLLGRKSRTTHEEFAEAAQAARQLVPEAQAQARVVEAVDRVRCTLLRYRRPAYCWSGGKDSAVLRLVCERAGLGDAMLGICDLEFPAFLAWVEQHRPPGLSVYNVGYGVEWLQVHPEMLFPAELKLANKWFRIVQNRAQERYAARTARDVLLFGRRLADGNRVGTSGILAHRSGVDRYSPLHDWSHEEILAVCAWFGLPMPPFYGWPRGYRVGTGPWPKRRVASVAQGWSETYQIDPDLVREMAQHFRSAAEFLESL